MAAISEVNPRLLEPSSPPTDIRCSHIESTGKWILEEFSEKEDAWMAVDEGHIYTLEAME